MTLCHWPPQIFCGSYASQPYCVLSFVSVSRWLVCILHFFNSGVGGAMCIPVVLPSEYPKGYMVLYDHFQVYTNILLCLVFVGGPLILGFCRQSIRATPTFLLVLLLLCVGACLCYLYNPAVVAFLPTHPSLCPLQTHWGRRPPPHSSYCIGATGVSPGVMVILR